MLWKSPRLSFYMGRQGIAVRTKWQSGIVVGDAAMWPLMGNRPYGNGGQAAGKSNPT